MTNLLIGTGSNDTLTGTDQNDEMFGYAGNDSLQGGAGNDTLYGGSGNNWLDGGEGNDILDAGEQNDTMLGGSGNDTLNGGKGNHVWDGGAGDDLFYHHASDSPLAGIASMSGGDGADTFLIDYGQWDAGSVTIDGGAGGDVFKVSINPFSAVQLAIRGGAGSNVYSVNLDYHELSFTVLDFHAGSGPDADLIDLDSFLNTFLPLPKGNPFAYGYFNVIQSGADVLLQYDGDGTVGAYAPVTVMKLANTKVGSLSADNFSHHMRPDGSAMSGELQTGTHDADSLTGWILDDTLDGGAGNDTLFGAQGDDLLVGGAGNDSLVGSIGADTVQGGEGNDILRALESGTALLDGGAGNDTLSSLNSFGATLLGGDGDDSLIIDGSRGLVVVDGGAGHDNFVFRNIGGSSHVAVIGGAGMDTYVTESYMWSTGKNIDITDFSVGVGGDRIDLRAALANSAEIYRSYIGGNPFAADSGHFRLVQQGNDTLFQYDLDGVGRSTAFQTMFVLKNTQSATLTADNFAGGFAPDGSEAPGLTLIGSDGKDTLAGAELADTIDGGADADRIGGGAGSDLLHGGSGDDSMEGGVGADKLYGDAGKDRIDGDSGDDLLDGGEGNDFLVDRAGNDTLLGGAGDDTLEGANHASVLDGGDGNDVLRGGTTVQGGGGDDLIQIRFIPDAAVRIEGGDGNDTIDGAGADFYEPGVIATLAGGTGSDTYRFNTEPYREHYTISDFTAGAGGDQIDLRPLLEYRDLHVRNWANPNAPLFVLVQQGADTLVRLISPGGASSSGYSTLVTLSNVNAASLTADNFSGHIGADGFGGDGKVYQGTDGNEQIWGGHFNDTVLGGAGNDTLNGRNGDDLLDGGAGDDALVLDAEHGNDTALGGDGNDTAWLNNSPYVNINAQVTVDLGAGDDDVHFDPDGSGVLSARITGSAGSDTYNIIADGQINPGTLVVTDFAAGAGGDKIDLRSFIDNVAQYNGPSDPGGNPFGRGLVRLSQDGADTLLQWRLQADTQTEWQTILHLSGVQAGSLAADNFVDHIDPSGGAVSGLALTQSQEQILRGGHFNDTLVGVIGESEIEGGGGDDLLIAASDGSGDTLLGGGGNDTLQGGSGRQTLDGGAGDDSIDGGAGNDLLQRGREQGNDTLLGGDGDDHFELSDHQSGQQVRANGGAGADRFNLDLRGDSNDLSLSGDGGSDIYVLHAQYDGHGQATVLDFVAGAGGDRIDLLDYLLHFGASSDDAWVDLATVFDGSNPFTTGHVRLVQDGDDTLLQLNVAGSPANFYTALVLRNVSASALTADNFIGGIPPDGGAVTGTIRSGTPAAESIVGSVFADHLDGGGGQDTIEGGMGNDWISSGGSVAGTKGSVLLAGIGNDTLLGGAGDDTLAGAQGDDSMDGGGGADSLYGGAGDDIYHLVDGKAVIREGHGEGFDTVLLDWKVADRYELPDYVENVTAATAKAGLYISGNFSANVITSSAFADTLAGGSGDDTYVLLDNADTVVELVYGGHDTAMLAWKTGGSFALHANLEDLTAAAVQAAVRVSGNELDNAITGGAKDDTIDGGAGSDTLDGGAGNDSMTGGSGHDTFIVNAAGDKVVEGADDGSDQVWTRLSSYTLTANVENLTATGSGAFAGTGNVLDNRIESGAGNDTLDGGAGNDVLVGGDGDDLYVVDNLYDTVHELGTGVDTVNIAFTRSGSFRMADGLENGTVTAAADVVVDLAGNAADNILTSNAGIGILRGWDGNDTLIGGGGRDILFGGAGDDVYVVSDAGAMIMEDGGEGTELVQTSLGAYVLGANVEHLAYTGDAAFSGTGNWLDNAISGGNGGARLLGSAGNDTLIGGSGNDSLQGGIGDDVLVVTGGKDTVDGGLGNDQLTVSGNFASYTITRQDASDTVLTGPGGQVVTVRNVEHFHFADGDRTLAQVHGMIASAGNDSLQGTDGDDLLDGLGGVDTLAGGTGDDIYVIRNTSSVVLENLDEGRDLAQVVLTAAGTYVLAANVENATVTSTGSVAIGLTGNALDNKLAGNGAVNTLLGGAGNDSLDGGAGNDVLGGGDGNDTLDGGAGADKMSGGMGNDTYMVDVAGDAVTEALNEGADTVKTALAAYMLGNNVEILDYTGKAAFTGTGNALANAISGGNGGSKLDGGAGDDTLTGGSGDDSLQGGIGDDSIVAAGGKDTIDGGLDNDELRIAGNFASYTVKRPNATDTVLTGADGSVLTVRNVETLRFDDGLRTLAQVLDNIASSGNDNLHGTAGNDLLDGLGGVDTLAGGAGDDIYVITNTASVVLEDADGGNDLAQVALTVAGTYALAANVDNATVTSAGKVAIGLTGNALDNKLTGNGAVNTLLGGDGNDSLDGGAGNDVLGGGDGHDTLDGGAGTDKMSGGAGNDTYVVDVAGDAVAEALNEGIDTIKTALATYTLSANLENLDYTGNATFTGTGNAAANAISGGNGGSKLDGGAGDDTLTGGSGNDSLQGGIGDDSIVAAGGKDTIDGGLGSDELRIAGNFASYSVKRPNAIDTVLTGANGSVLTVRNVENLRFDDGLRTLLQVQDNIVSAGNDNLRGTDGNDLLNGLGGVDTLAGGAGDDIYVIANTASVVLEDAGGGNDLAQVALTAAGTYVLAANLENATVTSTGSAAIGLSGNGLDNKLTGNGAVNTLQGGGGNDVLDGGAGNDVLEGGDGNDTLDGGAGTDKMSGGAGNDIYMVGVAGDAVTEALNEGIDTIKTALAAYTLGNNVENLDYTGKAAFAGTGNALANAIAGGNGGSKLDGGAGDDTLTGGSGNDSLQGGVGDDSIVAAGGKDTIDGGLGSDELRIAGNFASYTVKRPNAIDTVLTGADGSVLTLRNVENLRFDDGLRTLAQVQDNIASAGNDNLHGTAGNDLLDGLGGVDTLAGGAGDDIYVITNTASVVLEDADGGNDLAQVALTVAGTYALAANLENATVTSTGKVAIGLSGNALDNKLTGNGAANTLQGGGGNDALNGGAGNDVLEGGDGNDTLDGGAGADNLAGGAGDDLYIVDAAGDKVAEAPGAGIDMVETTLSSYTLGAHLDDLRYTGTASFAGTGNDLSNIIYGGAGADVLNGGGDDDVLIGGAGNNKLTGGAGRDSFVFGSPAASDTVTDFVSGTDLLVLKGNALAIGDLDNVLDGATTRGTPGGFDAGAELVLFTQRMATASTANAAAVIGSATNAYAVGDSAIFAVSTSSATTLYRFTSNGTDGVVSASELKQLVVLTGTPSISLADFVL